MAFGINVPVGFKLNPAGLKSAKKEFSSLGEHVKKGLEFAGIAVGIGEVLNLAKESVQLASEDLRSRKLLDLQIKNSTHSTEAQVKASEKYLDTLSLQIGKTKNELRPALANAVRGTGSLTMAQKLLKIAYDGSAASGKPVNIVMQALIKAQNGQTASLYKLSPQLKKTKGNLDDFAKSVQGAASASANPFDRFQVAVDELKIKFGDLLLPMINKFVGYLTTTVVPAVSNFLDQVANPKTDVGKAFTQIKDAVASAFDGVKNFFAMFGNGDAMKGFGNLVGALVRALPALLALKGIMMLSSAGSAIKNLVVAISSLRGVGANGTPTPISNTPTPVGNPVAPTGISGLSWVGISAATLSDQIQPDAAHTPGKLGALMRNSFMQRAKDAFAQGDFKGAQAYGQYGNTGDAHFYDKMVQKLMNDPSNKLLRGKGVSPTVINVNVQPGTSGPEVAKQLVKLLSTFDLINGTAIVKKK